MFVFLVWCWVRIVTSALTTTGRTLGYGLHQPWNRGSKSYTCSRVQLSVIWHSRVYASIPLGKIGQEGADPGKPYFPVRDGSAPTNPSTHAGRMVDCL